MKLGISTVVVQSMVAVLIGVVPGSAQDKTSWLSNPFEIASGVDIVPNQGGGFTREAVIFVTPSRLSIAGGPARSRWGIGYQPEFEFRFGNGTPKTWNHTADASFGHLFSRRTQVNFGDSVVTSTDPARTFSDNIFVMPRGNFLENSAAMAFSHESSSRTTLNTRIDASITKMSSLEEMDLAILNQKGIAGTAGLSQRFGRYQKITVAYSLLEFSPLRYENVVSTAQLAASIPLVQGSVARYAQTLAVSVSRSSPGPVGLASVGSEPGSTPAPAPSSAALMESTGPLLGVVTPVPTALSSATTSCELANNACSSAAGLQLLERPFHALSTTYTYSKIPGLLIEVSGGAMRDREMSYLLGLQLEQRFEHLWFSGQYQRFLSFYDVAPFQETPLAANISVPEGGMPSSTFSDLDGRVGSKFNRKTQLEMSLSLSNGTAKFVSYDLKSAIARARFTYELTDKFSFFVDAESFYENVRDIETTWASRQRYFGGIQVHFGQPPSSAPRNGN